MSFPLDQGTPGEADAGRFDRPFSEELKARAAADGLRKGERTRLRLMGAVAGLLQDTFVHGLRISDICRDAGVSQGTFYIYFTDRTDITSAMLTEFVTHVFDHLEHVVASNEGLGDTVYPTTLAYVREFRMNRGLFRALMQMTEESEHLERIYQQFNNRWNRRTAVAIARRRGVRGEPENRDLLQAFALGGMVDEFLANLYVRCDPALTERVESPEDAARLLADTWLQALPEP